MSKQQADNKVAVTAEGIIRALDSGAASMTAIAKRLGFKSGSSNIIKRIAAVPDTDIKARLAANPAKADAGKTPHGSPVVLHVEIGPAVLKTILDRLGGAQAWNRWLAALRDGGHLGGAWGEGEPEPPLCLWFEVGGDFAGRELDGIELWGVVSCDGIRLDGGSAVGATIGSCVRGSFRDADLRRSRFVDSVTGGDFRGANVEGASFDGATFDPKEPPVGLPDALLRAACRAESDEEPAGAEPTVGLVEHPVLVKASLAESATL